MKRIILTGGGTAGHVTPNLALIPNLQAAGFEIHYVGQAEGIERQLVEPLGIPYHPIKAGKLRRYLDWQNVTDIFRVGWGTVQAYRLLGRLRPDLVFSKGGFVACPLVWAAWARRVPVIAHESDLTPGLANKLSAPFAGQICYSFPETQGHLPPGKGVQTGIPIRESLHAGDPAVGRSLCGFADSKPVLLVIGGSQGAEAINQAVRAVLPPLLKRFNICHICGRQGVDSAENDRAGYKQFAYVDQDLAHLLALADLVVSRAGATTLFELLALGKPNLLIPLSRQASRGDQILNAASFAQQGFSQVLEEEELNPAGLIQAIEQAYHDRSAMSVAMRASDVPNGVEQVMALIRAATTTTRRK